MSFGLITANNIEELPYLLRQAALGYRNNADHDNNSLRYKKGAVEFPELWIAAAKVLEDTAEVIEEMIAETSAKEPQTKKFRARL